MANLTDLLPVLLQKTQEGKVRWEQLATESFLASVGDASFEVAKVKGVTQLSLRNTEGQRLEAVTWNLLRDPADKLLNQLYDEARRGALGVPQAIEAAIKLLEDL
jgi:hypothetical protein